MLSYGNVPLQVPSAQEAAWLAARIPSAEAFGFMRPRALGDSDPAFNPRAHFAWFLSRPFKLNSFYYPWGASRWGHAFVLADGDMMAAIAAQNSAGQALPFTIDDGLGSSITTNLFMLPPVPLARIMASPSLPLYLVPLVDERHRLWERGASIDVTEGTTTWSQLYTAIATACDISLTVDPIPAAYLKPSRGLTKHHQYLPLLLDQVASSVGQRIVRNLNGTYAARNPATATALMAANVNAYRKVAGGTLALGVVDG